MHTDLDETFRARSDFLTYELALRSSRMGFELFEQGGLFGLPGPGFIGDYRGSAGMSDALYITSMSPVINSFAEIAMFSPLQPTYRAYS